LAILIFTAQLPNVEHAPWPVYPLVAAGLAVIVLFPKLTRVIPAPLVAVVVLSAITMVGHIGVPTVSDKGGMGTWSVPSLALPHVPLTLHTLILIGPYSLAMAIVGLLESLMTAQLVDELTDTASSKSRECWGQGAANVFTGLCGGMGGCAMIGQTIINVKSGGRTRLSTFSAGVSVVVLVGLLGPIVGRIPMAALVAVMVLVAVSTFDWQSIRWSTLQRMPKGETAIMVITVLATVLSNDLAVGVILGVVGASLLFAHQVARTVRIASWLSDDGRLRTYTVVGQLFFASSNTLFGLFDYINDPERVVIDLSSCHVWDASSVAALDAVVSKYAGRGKLAEVVNLNPQSAAMHRTLSGQLHRA
jgi:SulP family sulfate permease